jgi:hypothetical protein
MKPFGKNSISTALRIFIDVALVLESIGITISLWLILKHLGTSNEAGKIMLSIVISSFIFGIISFLITLQLRKLINAFKKEAFFELKNVNRIRNISLLLLLYVIFDLVISQLNPNQQTFGIISKVIGNLPTLNTLLSFILAINYKILFLSAVIYVIARIFRNGNELKEQTTLTI